MSSTTSTNRSLHRRLLVTLLGVTAGAWILATYISYLDIKHEVGALFDAQLAQAADVLLSNSRHEIEEQALFDHHNQITDEPLLGLSTSDPASPYAHNVAYQVWIEPGQLAARSRSAPTDRLSAIDAGFSDRMIGGQRWRVFAVKHPLSPITVYTAESHDVRAALTRQVAFKMMLPILIALPLMALLIWFGVSRALKPLNRVADEIGRRAPADLKPIEPGDVPREVAPLITSMNDLFGRVEKAFENERRFTADASHELRTPLAGLKTHAQVALRSSDSKLQKRSLEQMVEAVNHANHLVAQLLTLARLDPVAESDTLSGEADLSEVAKQTIVDLGPAAFEKQIELGLDDHCRGLIRGNRDTLLIMLRNLVTNAIRYTPEHGKVRVKLQESDGAVELVVGDSGPGIAEQERSRVFERFYRELGTQVPGTGLGLSIVARIAELHNAEIRLGRSELGGLEVRLQFESKGVEG